MACQKTREACNRLYSKIQDESSMYELLKYPYDSALWCQWYDTFKRNQNMDGIKCLRRYVIRDTLQCCALDKLHYKKKKVFANHHDDDDEENGGEVKRKESVQKMKLFSSIDELTQCVKKTKMYFDGTQLKWQNPNQNQNQNHTQSDVSVVNEDCLVAAIRLKNEGFNPVVLNNASMRRPGGGYMNGAGAQEENLFRRSTYSLSLVDGDRLDNERDWHYPIPEFGAIYSPHVMVFRDSEDNGYGYLDEPVEMSFIAVAAYVRPQLTMHDKKRKTYHLAHKFAAKTKEKIRTILRVALLNGHDSVVLGAFGCGAFANPPEHLSILFDQVLFEEPEFMGAFKHVCFAIIEDVNSRGKAHNPYGNFAPFQQVFQQRTAKTQQDKDREQQHRVGSGSDDGGEEEETF